MSPKTPFDWRGFSLTPYPVSLATIYMIGIMFALWGASLAALEWFGGVKGLAMALFLHIPLPALLWGTVKMIKRDRRVGVKEAST